MTSGVFKRTVGAADRALSAVENVLIVVGGAAIALAMVFVSSDAVMRHLFSAPLTFQYTLTESYLMVMGFSLALPWGYRTGGRIRIQLLLNTMPKGPRILLLRAGNILAAIYLTFICWQALGKTTDAFVKNDLMMGVIDWPVGWSWVWIPIGMFMLVLRLLVDAFSDFDLDAPAAH